MLSPHVLKDTASKMYSGYGVLVGKNEIGEYTLNQEMGNIAPGFAVSSINYSKEDKTIIVLSNKALNKSYISGTLASILFNREVVPLYIHKPIFLDTVTLYQYAGKYALPTPVELVKKDGKLYLHSIEEPWESDILMLPESPNKLYSTSGEVDMQLEFINDEMGRITKVFMISRGLKKEIKKVN